MNRKKDFVAVRMRKKLALAAEGQPDDMPILVGQIFWSQMRQRMKREIEKATKVEYTRRNIFGQWKGRWIFVRKKEEDPTHYPEGRGIIEEIRLRQVGEWREGVSK
jgi:hypothetical protein